MDDEATPPDELMGPIVDAAQDMFPKIASDHLRALAATHNFNLEAIIGAIVQSIEDGHPYPKEEQKCRKRKISDCNDDEGSGDEEIVQRLSQLFEAPDRMLGRRNGFHRILAKRLLAQDFPEIYSKDIENAFSVNGGSLFRTYIYLSSATLDANETKPAWKTKKRVAKPTTKYDRDHLPEAIKACKDAQTGRLLDEFRAAREIHDGRVLAKDAERQAKQEEKNNFEQAKTDGTMAECGCCVEELPLNRMVHCKATATHWFCRDCARRHAETAIGYQKHNFKCMSMDGCDEGFSRDQIEIFLSPKSVVALDRLEMENSLRMSGIDNLESCPFCPFAAECEPVEIDREFRCQNEECGMVSCRLCREETHIPLSCEQNATEKGLSARRKIEEAMSAAIIRKCNKCRTPFIKDLGCNKMSCSKCGNQQCYICGQSCDYSHFRDTIKQGKSGDCPLFDWGPGALEQRHQDEVANAEKAARAAVQEQNPDLDDKTLKIEVSNRVKEDEERRKGPAGPTRLVHIPNNIPAPRQHILPNGFRDHIRPAWQPPAYINVNNPQQNLQPWLFNEPGGIWRMGPMHNIPMAEFEAVGIDPHRRVFRPSQSPGFRANDEINGQHHFARAAVPIHAPEHAMPNELRPENHAEINHHFRAWVDDPSGFLPPDFAQPVCSPIRNPLPAQTQGLQARSGVANEATGAPGACQRNPIVIDDEEGSG